MGRRVILDTNVLIDYERGVLDRTRLDDDELSVAAITVAEYRIGIELADTAERPAERSRALAAIVESVEILEYTETTAVHHARLVAQSRRSGRARGAHDLIIAAHAVQTGRVLLSRAPQPGSAIFRTWTRSRPDQWASSERSGGNDRGAGGVSRWRPARRSPPASPRAAVP